MSALRHSTRAVCYVLLSAHPNRVLIGACNPMLCPIWGFRYDGYGRGWSSVPDAKKKEQKDATRLKFDMAMHLKQLEVRSPPANGCPRVPDWVGGAR